MNFILCHFRQIVKKSELLSIPGEVLKNIISQDSLSIPTESNVLDAVLKWVVNDSSRIVEAESLLTAVPKDIQELVANARYRHKSGDKKRLTAVVVVTCRAARALLFLLQTTE